jgi:hypothetical protein
MSAFSLTAVKDHLSRRELSAAYQLVLAGYASDAQHPDVQEAADELAGAAWNAVGWHLSLDEGLTEPEPDSYLKQSVLSLGGVWALVCYHGDPFSYANVPPDLGGSAMYHLEYRLTPAERAQFEARARQDLTQALVAGKRLKGKALYKYLFQGAYAEAGVILVARAAQDPTDHAAQALLMQKHYRLLRPLLDASQGPQVPLLSLLSANDWAQALPVWHQSDKQGRRTLAVLAAAALEGVAPNSALVAIAIL